MPIRHRSPAVAPLTGDHPKAASLARWVPLAALLAAIAGAYALGLHHYISLEAIATHRGALADLVDDHAVLAVTGFMALYVAAVSLSFPAAWALTIAGGLLFGWALGAAASVIAATIGASIVFTIVKTSLGGILARRAGPLAARLARGFEEDAFSYLLFLRLVPAFPFFAVNAAAGLTGIPLRIFALATFIGIIPGATVFAYLGAGLDGLIAAQRQAYDGCVAARGVENCAFDLDPSALLSTHLVLALAGLGALALVPVAVRRWKARPD